MIATNLLLQMIYHSKMIQEQNFKNICSIATNVLGLPNGSLAFKNRSRNIQSARASVCYIAFTEENIDRNIIAKVLSKDRTSTYHYIKTHKKKFNECEVYRNTFTKIYKKYKNYQGNKNIFDSKIKLKNYLLKNRVIESKTSDVLLEVQSGKAICNIKTNYFDYLNQLENISFALKNYNYNVKIK